MRLIDADAIQDEYMRYHDGKRIVIVDMAPTVEERKTGKWLRSIDNDVRMYECSACGARMIADPYETAVGSKGLSFCPYCGAEMREG